MSTYGVYPPEGGGGAITSGDLTDAGTDGIVITNGTGAVLGTGTQVAQHVADATHNGYLLNTDWVTFNSKFNLPSLTAGSVIFSDGTTLAQDNANFFYNSATHRLGIGTTTPLSALTIKAQTDDNDKFLTIQGTGTTNYMTLYMSPAGAFSFINFYQVLSYLTFDPSGGIRMGGASATFPAQLAVQGFTSFDVPTIIAKKQTAQTADLFEATDTDGTIFAKIDISGNISGTNLSGTNTGNVSLTAVGSSPSANAASLSGQALTLQPFDGTHPGVVTASGGGSANFLRADGTWATPAGTGITALTGDVTASGSGSVAATLATVNANVGTFASATFNGKGLATAAANLSGDATTSGAALTLATVNGNVGSFGSTTAIPNITVNGKGLITAVSTSAVVAPAGTLTGTTLASNVVTSSLTSVGTIATGVWNGTAVDVAHGGTGDTSLTAYAVLCGGTTSTGVVQSIASVGTSGQVLTSNGAGALPTFQPASGGSSFVTATGGSITTNGNYKVHTFTTSGTFTVTAGSGGFDVLVVGGGGGGGGGGGSGASRCGGAGGAGNVIFWQGLSLLQEAVTVTIGGGGAGSSSDNGANGSISSFGQISALGGGGGGGNTTAAPSTGGCGGGGSGTVTAAGGTAQQFYGFAGGAGSSGSNTGGGGGGASAVGGAAGGNGGNGGAGIANSITGSSVTYGGGGGGGATGAGGGGTGGAGGGGAGGATAPAAGTAGTANTGGGGGGGSGTAGTSAGGGAGGSGVVIVTYKFQ